MFYATLGGEAHTQSQTVTNQLAVDIHKLSTKQCTLNSNRLRSCNGTGIEVEIGMRLEIGTEVRLKLKLIMKLLSNSKSHRVLELKLKLKSALKLE